MKKPTPRAIAPKPRKLGPAPAQSEQRPMMAELRRRAEARLRKQRRDLKSKAKAPKQEVGGPRPEADTKRLVHELQVHQVELEMQNAELKEARDRMELFLEKYTDLYDFAPVGYFSLDELGEILEVNLTGAALLGVGRARLIGQRLPRFMPPASQTVFRAFLDRVFAGVGKQVCEAPLLKEKGGAFWANFHGASALSVSSPRKWCRVAVSDITFLKQAEEAQHRVEALAATNLELHQEIVRRQAVEEDLRQSEEHQMQMLEESRQMQEQLRHLSHQILQAQEDERKRISRELHDDVTQILIGINVHLETLARDAAVNPETLKQQVAQTQRLVEKSVQIVHQFALELRPTSLDDLGLIATLHSYMKDFIKRTGVRVQFTTFTSERIDELNNVTRTVFYRVAQEALTNVARHAHATQVKLSLQKLPHALLMQITDNGQSFDVKRVLHAKKNKRLGLLGMRERVEMVGGKLSIESTPGQGTTIRAEIPFGNGPAGRR